MDMRDMIITIKTPQPDIEERLVLVRTDARPHEWRDATPEDMARGGWVREEDGSLLDYELRRVIDVSRKGLETRVEAVLRLAAAHAEAIARTEKAERLRPNGVGEPLDVELGDVFAQRQRDNVTGPHTVSPLRAVYRLGVAHERARHAQATKGRATDGDLLAMAADAYRLRSREDATLADMRALALAVAARVRQEAAAVSSAPVTSGAAGEEELTALALGIARKACEDGAQRPTEWLARAVAAVAARVRQEPGLIERLVAAGWDLALEQSSGTVDVYLTRPKTDDDEGEHFEGELVERSARTPPADVPATIARLAEVSRG